MRPAARSADLCLGPAGDRAAGAFALREMDGEQEQGPHDQGREDDIVSTPADRVQHVLKFRPLGRDLLQSAIRSPLAFPFADFFVFHAPYCGEVEQG